MIMSVCFLSDEWFQQIETLTVAAGDIHMSKQLSSLILNLAVHNENGLVEMSMNGGKLEKGFQDNASVTMKLPADLARKIFIDLDQNAAMQGFIAGQITVDGDMGQLVALQTVQPSAEQKALLAQIASITA